MKAAFEKLQLKIDLYQAIWQKRNILLLADTTAEVREQQSHCPSITGDSEIRLKSYQLT